MQDVVPPVYHPALEVTFSGWARLAPSQGVTSTQVVTAQLAIMEGERVAGTSTIALDPAEAWVPLSAQGKISASAFGVQLLLAAANSNVQFDDMSMDMHGVSAPWNDLIYGPSLVDPSGEEAPLGLREGLRQLVPGEVAAMADVVANAQPFDKGALWRDYAYYQYRSFWGSFGWLSINLPSLFYTLMGLLVLAALAGLVVRLVRKRAWSRWAWLGLVTLLALLIAIGVSFAKQTSLLAYAGQPAYPQGRYLLVLTIPIVWLLPVGLIGYRVLSTEYRVVGTRHRGPGTLAVWLWANALLFFASYSLFALVLPYYYG
jgi:hypothetical protein